MTVNSDCQGMSSGCPNGGEEGNTESGGGSRGDLVSVGFVLVFWRGFGGR